MNKFNTPHFTYQLESPKRKTLQPLKCLPSCLLFLLYSILQSLFSLFLLWLFLWHLLPLLQSYIFQLRCFPIIRGNTFCIFFGSYHFILAIINFIFIIIYSYSIHQYNILPSKQVLLSYSYCNHLAITGMPPANDFLLNYTLSKKRIYRYTGIYAFL